jgi:hypothetical protein
MGAAEGRRHQRALARKWLGRWLAEGDAGLVARSTERSIAQVARDLGVEVHVPARVLERDVRWARRLHEPVERGVLAQECLQSYLVGIRSNRASN